MDTSLPARAELTEAQYAQLERHIIHALPLPVVSIPVPLDAEQRQRLTAELLEQMVQAEGTKRASESGLRPVRADEPGALAGDRLLVGVPAQPGQLFGLEAGDLDVAAHDAPAAGFRWFLERL